ncbi:MAG: hypothetical protein E6Y30_09000 [Finegoldia magna]|nr:hypothetical protein [Finegoldia magna]
MSQTDILAYSLAECPNRRQNVGFRSHGLLQIKHGRYASPALAAASHPLKGKIFINSIYYEVYQ